MLPIFANIIIECMCQQGSLVKLLAEPLSTRSCFSVCLLQNDRSVVMLCSLSIGSIPVVIAEVTHRNWVL